MEDLQLRDRALALLSQPGLTLERPPGYPLRHPPVPLAQHADEVRPAAADLLQADRQHLALRRGLLGDTPAQVDVAPDHASVTMRCATRTLAAAGSRRG
jgi:hypothetical protein